MYFEDDEDYFGESVDETFEEIKQTIKNCAKKEIKDEIEQLKENNKQLIEENNKLSDIKKDWDKKVSELERDYSLRKYELEREYERLKNNVLSAPIRDLVHFIETPYYSPKRTYDYPPKCDKCDDNRELEVVDCYNIVHKVPCKCSERTFSDYFVEEKKINYIDEISKDREHNRLRMFVEFNIRKEDDYITGKYFDPDKIIKSYEQAITRYERYEKEVLEPKNRDSYVYGFYFESKEDCEKFCEFLNNKKKEENKTE